MTIKKKSYCLLNPADPVRPRMHDTSPAYQTQFSFPSLFCTMEPEPVQPGMLINVCKYLDSLQYRVWKKMVMSVETGEWGCGQVVQAWEALPARQRAR